MLSLLASPAMLLWGLAATLPVLLHLLLRRRRREMPWAAMRLLRATVQRSAPRFRLWQWLLLLLRSAALLLLAWALARPMLPAAGGSLTREARQLRVLVLDASYSMQAEEGPTTRWQRAVDAAQQRIEAANASDGWLIVTMADPPRAVVGQVAFDGEAVRETLDSLAPTDGTADVAATVALVEAIVPPAVDAGAAFDSVVVHFFTDFQRLSWTGAEPALRQLAESYEVDLVDVSEGLVTNGRWQSLARTAGFPTAGAPLTFEAVLHSAGPLGQEDRLVQWLVDDQVRQSNRISIPAGGSARIRWSERLEAGVHTVTVQAEPDLLRVDDVRRLVTRVMPRLDIGIVGSDPAARRLVRAAVDVLSNASSLRIREGGPEVLQSDTLDVAILCDLDSLSATAADDLRRLIRRGGGVLLFAGPRVDADSYNAQLWDAPTRLLPAALGPPTSPGMFSIDPLEYEHEIVETFRDYPGAGLESAPVFRLRQLAPADAEGARTVVAVGEGMPLIMAERFEPGAVVLVATAPDLGESADTAWTALPAWPSFPVLVHRMLEWLTAAAEAGPLVVGQRVVPPSDLTLLSSSARLVQPDGAARPLEPAGAVVQQAGIYTLELGETRQPIAVNVDPAEGDLTPAEPIALPKSRGVNPPAGDRNRADRPEAPEGRPLFREALLGVGGLLLLETLLGRWLRDRA